MRHVKSFLSGNTTVKLVPFVNWVRTFMLPVWASIISFAKDKPSP